MDRSRSRSTAWVVANPASIPSATSQQHARKSLGLKRILASRHATIKAQFCGSDNNNNNNNKGNGDHNRKKKRESVLVWLREGSVSLSHAFYNFEAIRTGQQISTSKHLRLVMSNRLVQDHNIVHSESVRMVVVGSSDARNDTELKAVRSRLPADVLMIVVGTSVVKSISGSYPRPVSSLPVDASALVLANSVLISEISGSGVLIDFSKSKEGQLVGGKKMDSRDIKQRAMDLLKSIYLPYDYPDSVTRDYGSFTKWRVLQNLASAVMNVLSTEALLFGLGLGKTSTKATAAATNWVLKDGLGYIGKVIYGYAAGKQFDHDPKSWRIASDLVEDLGGMLELLTPLFPGDFLLLASIATTLKGMAAMTGTATRHSIYKSLALRDNQGDIATKGESQGVTCKIVGLGVGIGISNALGQNYFKLLMTYGAFTLAHMLFNWQSMKCVQFSTLNRQRSAMILKEYFAGRPVETPYETSHHEKIMIPWMGYQSNIVLGATIKQAFSKSDEVEKALKDCGSFDKYLVSYRNGKIYFVFHKTAKHDDYMKAWMTGLKFVDGGCKDLAGAAEYTRVNFGAFKSAAKASNWQTDYYLLNPRKSRARW